MKRIFETVKKTLNDICLIDMILMAYMGILLIYIAIHLICSTTLQESTSVDTIIRTSASAIFGYIISNNFISSNSDTEANKPSVSNGANFVVNENEVNKTNIQTQNNLMEQNNIKKTDTNTSVCFKRLQIIVVSVIGFIVLVLLLISKKYTQTTPEFSATISQLRDFLSASIGFLVSCGKSK